MTDLPPRGIAPTSINDLYHYDWVTQNLLFRIVGIPQAQYLSQLPILQFDLVTGAIVKNYCQGLRNMKLQGVLVHQICPVGEAFIVFQSHHHGRAEATCFLGHNEMHFNLPSELEMLAGTSLIASDKLVYFVGGLYPD